MAGLETWLLKAWLKIAFLLGLNFSRDGVTFFSAMVVYFWEFIIPTMGTSFSHWDREATIEHFMGYFTV